MPSLREEIFLIGYSKHQIVGSKLPSKRDCLKVFFYNMRTTKLTAKDSANLVVRECIIFWEKGRIPVLIEVTGFIVSCYSNFWFDSNKAYKAALNDIIFWRNLENYKTVNQNIADKAISKLLNHLYYLNEECVGFCLFDERIDNMTKRKLVAKMSVDTSGNEDEEIPKKLIIKKENLKSFISRDNSDILQNLFSKNTKKVFKRFGISMEFFSKDPHSWSVIGEYLRAKQIIQNLSVVNDCAERGIQLIQEYHDKITKDEEQKQHLMKVVQKYRQLYPKNANLHSLQRDFDL